MIQPFLFLLAPPAPVINQKVRLARTARAEDKPRNILFCLSGHGHFDLASYESFLTGKLHNGESESTSA